MLMPPSQNLVEVRIAAPQPETLPKSWTTHKDPAGFVVNLPANWTVGKVSSNGQVVLHGTRGEEILIWPLHLQQSELDAQGAAAMVQELARKFDALMPWSSVQTMTNATRVMGMGAEHSGSALLSWANGPGAASVCFYGIEAPGEVYRDSTDSFAAILKSFHVVPISSNEGVPEAANGSCGRGVRLCGLERSPRKGFYSVRSAGLASDWRRISAEPGGCALFHFYGFTGRPGARVDGRLVGRRVPPTHASALRGRAWRRHLPDC